VIPDTRFKKLAVGIAVASLALALVGAFWLFVRTQPQPAYPELAEINQTWSFDAYKDYFVNLAQKKSAMYAFSVLRNADIPSAISIHRVAHEIGYVHFEQKGLAGIYSCTTDFRYACEHAVVVQALITLGAEALQDVARVCSEGPGGVDAYVHCFHGVGHGLMAYLGYDYEEAVGTCKQVYDIAVTLRPDVTGKRLWHECIGGATMELMDGEHDKDAQAKAKLTYMPASDILMPCDADFISNEVRPICYSYLKPRFFEAAGVTGGVPSPEAYPKALSYCKKIPDDEFGSRDGCYAGFGAGFAYLITGDESTFQNASDSAIVHVHELCSLADDSNGRVACDLAALDIIFWSGQSGVSAATSYCSLAPDAGVKGRCFAMLFSYGAYSFPDKTKRSAFCAEFPAEYAETCMSAEPSASYVQ
jgi:hypothetical protein